jgi:hypothetical protein
MRRRLVLASALALLLAVVLVVGAPPSEFVPRDSRWWMLEPLMFPGLFAGVILDFVALILSYVLSGVRAAATFCVLAPLSTLIGLVIAEGLSDHAHLRFDTVCVALLAVPVFAGVGILTRAGRGLDGPRGGTAEAGAV